MNLDKVFLSMAKWKKIALAVAAVVFIIRIGYIAFRGEVDRGYYTSEQYDLEDAKTMPCQELSQVFVSKSNWGGYLAAKNWIVSNFVFRILPMIRTAP